MMHYGIKKMVKCIPQCIYFSSFQSHNAPNMWYFAFEIGLNLMARWRNSWYSFIKLKKKKKKYGMQQIVSFGQWLEIWMCEGA